MLLHRARARMRMLEHGLDALVATSPENVTYATGYGNWTIYTFRDQEVYGVVPKDGPVALVVPIDAMDHLAQVPVDAARLYTYGTFHTMRDPNVTLAGEEARLFDLREHTGHYSDALAALRQALGDLKAGASIGVDERGMPPSRWRRLVSTLSDRTIVEAHDLFRVIRMVKTDEEIARLRATARAVEQAMLAAFERAAPGVTEAELEQTFREAAIARGVTPGHYETSAGTRSSGCFPASATYHLRQGDVIKSDVGGRLRGYWADTGRVAALGASPAKLARYHEALTSGIHAILRQVKPGVTGADLFRTGVEAVRAGGIPQYRRHHVGHAIGLEFYEAPILNDAGGPAGGDLPLETGMVINVELPYYELGLGGLQIEDTLVVRPDGYERLTSAPHEMLPAGAPLLKGARSA
ncbi:MAG TPA: Xaa-Pro peptidase family protein [bacterium]|nr:Xaa-Pro peptidase family protein [bacterium]